MYTCMYMYMCLCIYVYVYVYNAFSVTKLGITGFDTLISQNNTVAWYHLSMEYTRSNMSDPVC